MIPWIKLNCINIHKLIIFNILYWFIRSHIHKLCAIACKTIKHFIIMIMKMIYLLFLSFNIVLNYVIKLCKVIKNVL